MHCGAALNWPKPSTPSLAVQVLLVKQDLLFTLLTIRGHEDLCTLCMPHGSAWGLPAVCKSGTAVNMQPLIRAGASASRMGCSTKQSLFVCGIGNDAGPPQNLASAHTDPFAMFTYDMLCTTVATILERVINGRQAAAAASVGSAGVREVLMPIMAVELAPEAASLPEGHSSWMQGGAAVSTAGPGEEGRPDLQVSVASHCSIDEDVCLHRWAILRAILTILLMGSEDGYVKRQAQCRSLSNRIVFACHRARLGPPTIDLQSGSSLAECSNNNGDVAL